MKRDNSYEFDILLNAILSEPWKVRDIVKGDEEVLSAINSIGENVLHYLAVENKLEEVKLLRSLGSMIPPYAIAEAASLGHTDMVSLLLELGGEPSISSCSDNIELGNYPKKKKYEMRGIFRAYGYTLDEI